MNNTTFNFWRLLLGAIAALVVGPILFVIGQRCSCNARAAYLIQVIAVIWIIVELWFLYYNLPAKKNETSLQTFCG
jgi:hypothetical protein